MGVDLNAAVSFVATHARIPVTFRSYSAAAALEWRGYATVQAVAVLRGTAL